MDNLVPTLERYKLPVALSLVGIVLILGGVFISNSKSSQKQFPQESVVTGSLQLAIDVSGAVEKPGVYKLEASSRVEDAINAAGGFTDQANIIFISKQLNLARKLTDGMKIYVPFVGEKDTDLAVSQNVAGVSATSTAPVNINAASQNDLEALPGIGPTTAGKIISNRPYQSIEELLNKKIVGKAVFTKIKDQISI
ncbi:MAG: helix-hairpin-helix domain-containing protein [Candidatus Daviesbacteria bacterium]|nr:MAG: helix-hairpin-helix domain-containing protein [Candidatus Daviesbacteria bacterium]